MADLTSRREFVEAVAGGLLITVWVPDAQAQSAATGGTLGARLNVAADGAVTIFTGKVELGQGARTELAMAAAEEMQAPFDSIRMVMADTDLVPDDGITAGSRTTPGTVPLVRRAAAIARGLLVAAAAKEWGVDAARLQVRDGKVAHPGGRESYDYARLARSAEFAAALKAALPAEAPLRAVKDWNVLGQPRLRIGAREIVTGAHRYPSDIRRPGMLYGAVLRPPSYGATLVSADLSAAEKMTGVVVVRDGDFVGCAAPTFWEARQAVAAIAAKAEWKTAPHPASTELFAYLKANAARQPRVEERGSVAAALNRAHRRVRAAYQVPFIQHAPMEPRAAVAEWVEGKVTIWTGTSGPFGVKNQVAQAFRLAPGQVRIIVPDTGISFGGKHTGECAVEAARLARAAGRPVSLRWSRAEEFTWASFRPAGLFEIEAGLDEQGRLVAWDFTNYNAGTAAMASPYRCENVRTAYYTSRSPLREGSYRAIGATANNFARECLMDEAAEAAGQDPLDFRLAHLDNQRLRDVLEEAARRFRWRERRAQRKPGIGVGLACCTEKGSVVAACVEVELGAAGAPPKVREMVTVFECGAVLNPLNVRAQVDGCLIQGLGGALTEEIRFSGGRIENASFARYPVPRFRDVPRLETVILPRPDLPSAGAGETPITIVAPAIASALFHATGRRSRAMPLRPGQA